MRGDIRCIDGKLWRRDPQPDDPDHKVAHGGCPDCRGYGCESDDAIELEIERRTRGDGK